MTNDYEFILNDSKERALKFLAQVDERRVFPHQQAIDGLSAFNESLPEEGLGDLNTLDLLDRVGAPAAVANMGKRYFGFVVGGSLPVAVAANWLMTAWDQVASYHLTSPMADRVEKVAAGWILDILDLPRESAVGFVTGATVASFTALSAARHKILNDQGFDVENDGLYGAPKITVVVSQEVHVTILKALSMLGLGKNNIIRVPTDNNGAIDITKFPELGPNTLVCVQAGNVNSGAFDPIDEICTLAHKAGAWVHVDGAIGLWARTSKKLADQVKGIEKADSWSTDGHKWLNVPYDNGIVICRHKDALRGAMSTVAAYVRGAEDAAKDVVPEFSRRGRGIDVWAALRSLGRKGIGQMIERNCNQARNLAAELKNIENIFIHNDVVLNQIVVSYGTEDMTKTLIDYMQQEGTCWFGSTIWKGRETFRISISSWKTTDEDIILTAEAFRKAVAVLAQK
ncbi:MAG: aminotransferase class V-fold PLP-dependent enzyme [Emcibacter sp.]|nr:aminotransferase class V-fold PLP-dependent enzyme [Emcibacter sp.]